MKRFHPNSSAQADRFRDGGRIRRPVEATPGNTYACHGQDVHGHPRRAM